MNSKKLISEENFICENCPFIICDDLAMKESCELDNKELDIFEPEPPESCLLRNGHVTVRQYNGKFYLHYIKNP